MSDLNAPLSLKLAKLMADDRFADDDRLNYLINSINDGSADIEHLITFLDDAPSNLHRSFANEMKLAFEEVLRNRLSDIKTDLERDPIDLYEILLDIYNIPECPESLGGIITTNYDDYLEKAITSVTDRAVDFGINIEQSAESSHDVKVKANFGLLKLHGSFSWKETLPISTNYTNRDTLWIPPGIQKAKQSYPFNILSGLARDMLSCDILRVIGCRLGPNDWDLVSLLFTMCHVAGSNKPSIEVIDTPLHAERLKELYPYLPIVSILEVEPTGSEFIADFMKLPSKPYVNQSQKQKEAILKNTPDSTNWFQDWLRHKASNLYTDLPTIETKKKFRCFISRIRRSVRMIKQAKPWTVARLREMYPFIEFPEYQREPNLWVQSEKQRLIDSIIRSFDIASLYFYIHADGTIDCVDGRQRIGTIMEFCGQNDDDISSQLRFSQTNEIYDDVESKFAPLDGMSYREILELRDSRGDELASNFIKSFLAHQLTVVLLSDSDRPEEFNLQFTRLNLGTIINSGEKLNAMVGELRDVCFDRLGTHAFLESTSIPTRRYARANVAAQIMTQVFSKVEDGEYTRVRHLDLQKSFKQHSRLSIGQKDLVDDIERLMDLLEPAFADRNVLRNRAITVSIVLLAWESEIDDEQRANSFGEFVDEFAHRLQWQIKKGLLIDSAYHYLSNFQRSITQASAEKTAFESRLNVLRVEMTQWELERALSGDADWEARHDGLDPRVESRK